MKRLLPILLLVFSVGVGAETIEYEGGAYAGKLVDGVPHSQGTYTFANGAKYVGEFKDGKIVNGQGTETHPDGDKYVGEFKDGKKHGQGTYTFPSGQKYVGQWKDDKEHGQGTWTHPDGDEYVGEWRDGKPWKGTEYDKDRNVNATFSDGVMTKSEIDPDVSPKTV